MKVSAERYVEYYRDILGRIANGWESPASLASLALGWTIHHPNCSYSHSGVEECDQECEIVTANDGDSKHGA